MTYVYRKVVLQEISHERDRQDKKWGYPQRNSDAEWGIILGEEYGEYLKALNELRFRSMKNSMDDMKRELIQTAAVVVAILEHLALEGR